MMSARRCLASTYVLTLVAVLGVKLKPTEDNDLSNDFFKPKDSRDNTLVKTMNEAIEMQMERHTKKSTELEEKNAALSTKIEKLQKSMEGGAEAMMADLEAHARKRNRLRKKKAEQREKQVVEAETKQTTELEKAEEDKLEEGEEDTVRFPMTHAEAKALRRQARKEALLDTMQQQLAALRADEKELHSEIKMQEHALAPEAARISALEKRASDKKRKHDLKTEIALIKSQFEQDSKIVQELLDYKAALSEKAEQLQKRVDGGVDSSESETENSADSAEFSEDESVQPPKTKAEVKQLRREARKEAAQHKLDAMPQELEELRHKQNQLQVARDTVKTDMHAMEKVKSKVQKLEQGKLKHKKLKHKKQR